MVRQHSSKPLAKEKRMSLNQTQRSFHIIHCDYKFVQPEFKDWKIVPELSLPVPRIFQWAGKNAKAVELNSIASRVMDEFSISTDDLIVLMNPLDCKEFWIDDYHCTEEAGCCRRIRLPPSSAPRWVRSREYGRESHCGEEDHCV